MLHSQVATSAWRADSELATRTLRDLFTTRVLRGVLAAAEREAVRMMEAFIVRRKSR